MSETSVTQLARQGDVLTNEEARNIANAAISYVNAWGAYCCPRHNDIHPDDVFVALQRTISATRPDESLREEIAPAVWGALWKRAAIRWRQIARSAQRRESAGGE